MRDIDSQCIYTNSENKLIKGLKPVPKIVFPDEDTNNQGYFSITINGENVQIYREEIVE